MKTSTFLTIERIEYGFMVVLSFNEEFQQKPKSQIHFCADEAAVSAKVLELLPKVHGWEE